MICSGVCILMLTSELAMCFDLTLEFRPEINCQLELPTSLVEFQP